MYQPRDVPDVGVAGELTGPYGHPVARVNPRGEAFGALLRTSRQKAKLTQDEVVERSGISRSTYLRWEAGDAIRTDPDKVRAVCHVLGIDHRQALVALGYLDPADVTPAEAGRPLHPDLEEIIDILQDPRVPSVAKEALVGYLRQLRHQITNDRRQDRKAS
jgi:transcriptional regulator with XRE-family HTH domain